MSRPNRLNFTDAVAVRRFIVDLRLAFDDADAVTRDALRPLGQRELGRVLHLENYRGARERIVELLTLAAPPDGDPEPSDPAGCGGSPAH